MTSQRTTTPTKQLPRRKRILFHCVMIFLVLAPLIALEGYVRASRPHLDLWVKTGRKIGPSPMREWGLIDAFSAYRGRPGSHTPGKSVNSLGFISTPELVMDKPPGTTRIVFLGGSSTAGTGNSLPDEATWPWRVTEILRRRFPAERIEFLNGALGGYTSFESYGRLWSRIRFFSPDIIVVYHGWNEMYYFNRDDDIARWRMLPDGDWSFDRTARPVRTYDPRWIDHPIRRSQVLTRLRLRLSEPQSGEAGASLPLADDYDRRGLEIWRTNLRLLRETARLLGAELFVAKQATLIVPGLAAQERARVRYDYHGFDHEAHLDAFRRLYAIIDEEVPPERVIDVTTISGRPECFHDHVHPTEAGVTEIAAMVAEALASCFRAGEAEH